MKKEREDLVSYLEKGLVRPAEAFVVMAFVDKMLKSNVKHVFSAPDIYYCPKCKKWITEDQIRTVETFKQTLEEPAEYEDFCECGGSGEDFEEFNIDAETLCDIFNKQEFEIGEA